MSKKNAVKCTRVQNIGNICLYLLKYYKDKPQHGLKRILVIARIWRYFSSLHIRLICWEIWSFVENCFLPLFCVKCKLDAANAHRDELRFFVFQINNTNLVNLSRILEQSWWLSSGLCLGEREREYEGAHERLSVFFRIKDDFRFRKKKT